MMASEQQQIFTKVTDWLTDWLTTLAIAICQQSKVLKNISLYFWTFVMSHGEGVCYVDIML